MDATLYVIPGSHAARGGMLMLEQKGIPDRIVTLKPGLHAMGVRARGFPGRTVPGLRIDGHRVQTNRKIARYLDEQQPEPPRRRPTPSGARRRRGGRALGGRGAATDGAADRLRLRDPRPGRALRTRRHRRLGHLLSKSENGRRRIAGFAGKHAFGVSEEQDRADRAALPAALDNVDAWIGSGVLGGDPPNAADCLIAPCIALLMYILDLREEIERRPCGELAERILPEPAPVSA